MQLRAVANSSKMLLGGPVALPLDSWAQSFADAANPADLPALAKSLKASIPLQAPPLPPPLRTTPG